MSKEIYISSTPHETRLAIVEKEELSEIYYERENEYTLAGSIYNGRVTRVLPGMQSAFVDIGLERDAFLYITDFLEDQGEDSSEYDTGEPKREGRDNREAREGRGDRNNDRRRGEGRTETRGEGRTETRGEGRDDRDGRGDRNARNARTRTPEAAEATEGFDAAPAAEPYDTAPQGEPADDTEEGAEGSRRWRGRRGRRRSGRGGESRSAAPESTPAGETGEAPEDFAPEPLEFYGEAAEEAPAAATEEQPQRERGGRDRGGRERGGRGRDRDRGGRDRDRGGDREARPQRPEAGDAEPAEGAAEAFILPGESIARYRQGSEPEAAAVPSASVGSKPRPTYLTARASTEIDLSLATWDGGAALPGESLSRRRESRPATQEHVAAAAAPQGDDSAGESSSARGSDRRRDRDRKRGRGGRNREEVSAGSQTEPQAEPQAEDTPGSFRSGAVARESLDPQEAVQPGISSAHEPEAADLTLNAGFAAEGEERDYEPVTDHVVADSSEQAQLEAAVGSIYAGLAGSDNPDPGNGPEFQEETHEYEPGDDASASYRVDPAGPSEYRQSSSSDDDPEASEAASDAFLRAEAEGEAHEFTAVQGTGEMLSELPGEVAIPGVEIDPTNPIEHETAVLTERADALLGEQSVAQPAEGNTAGDTEAPQQFAPGDGVLEEELLDDEDNGDLLDVTASYSEDTEEETFEAANELDPQLTAHLGSLVRDRAVDQITQVDTFIIDDDDFDSDDLEEADLEEDDPEQAEVAGMEMASLDESTDEEAATDSFDDRGGKPSAASMGEFPEFTEPRGGRRDEGSSTEGRHGNRRGGEGRGDREGRSDRGGRSGGRDRDRRGMAGSRGGRDNGRGSRGSMQTTDLPAISDLLKPGQEVLVQIAKEPIAKKGARITSHIALPGRFLVFMPTVNHVGVSRKIESDSERRRLKEVLLSEKGDAAGGFIVRTAAANASEDELRSDLRFLLNLWSDIKQRSEGSKSPALIYHDLNLVERILRDQVTDNFSAIWCDTEVEYERVLRFLQRFEPSLMRRVKLYTKDTPLFEQFGISEEINKALRSKVWLKSGGSIVINQTEALVAIDINTGKYVGKTARLEDTIVKTNLDAIPEIVRQIRLRDLGGIIVIDFIDMDDRKNRQKVLIALEEELKKDRAPSKVLQFNDFGLVAITRKRVKQSLERTLSTTCGICAGTGMVKSPTTVCNEIYIELRKMHKQLDKGDVMLRVNPEVVKHLKSNNAKWLQEMEEIAGKTILIKSDPSLHPEQFDIH